MSDWRPALRGIQWGWERERDGFTEWFADSGADPELQQRVPVDAMIASEEQGDGRP